MKLYYICFLFIFILFSCRKENNTTQSSKEYNYNLLSSGKIKSFPLNSDTKYNPFYLYVFEDENKRNILSFLNYNSNQILFYDFDTNKHILKVDFEREGPNGINAISGYYIQDFNNIYLSSYSYTGLIKVDTAKHIIQKIPYGTTDSGYKIIPSYTASSHPYVPPIIINDKIYITQPAVAHIHPIKETPLSVIIDSTNCSYKQLPLDYTVLTDNQIESKDTRFSRIFDGKNFIYSFYIDEDILISSINHDSIKKIKVKSKYINNIPLDAPSKDFKKGAKENLEVARYGDLIYDKYRDVYYRFVYPSVQLDDNVEWRGRAVYGRKKFSIIILDKNFNIIGETLFPEGIYNSYVFFVHKDGLYISKDYQMNYDQSEDFLTFELFNLIKKE